MMKKILFFSFLIIVSLGNAQTKTWDTRPADNASLPVGDPLVLSITYDAGDDGGGTDYTVGGAALSGIQYSLQTRTGTGTVEDPYIYGWVVGATQSSTSGTHEGTDTLNWTVPNETLSADLPAGTTYILRVVYQNSNNDWASGAEDFPVVLVAGAVAPTSSWGTRPSDNAVLNVGDALDLTAMYDAGNSSGLVDYTVGGASSNHVQFSISEKTGSSYSWKAGSNDTNTGTTHSGTASVNWTVPNITLSADLPVGTTHVLRVGYQNNQDAWASGAAEIPITIEAPVAGVDNDELNKVSIYPNPTTGEINLSELSGAAVISLSNMAGQVVAEYKFQASIDISELPAGIYMLQSDNGLNRQIIKI